jgi:uncharacterized protein
VGSDTFLRTVDHGIRAIATAFTEEYLGSWIALSATSAFFGARHLGNPDATVIGLVFLAIKASVPR